MQALSYTIWHFAALLYICKIFKELGKGQMKQIQESNCGGRMVDLSYCNIYVNDCVDMQTFPVILIW